MSLCRIIMVITLTAAIFSAVFCGILLVLKFVKDYSKLVLREVLLLLLGFYLLSIGYFSTVFYSIFYTSDFKWTGTLSFLSVILVPVVFYHLVFNASTIHRMEQFNLWHYFLPLALGIGYIVYCNFYIFLTEDHILYKYSKILRVLFNQWTLYFVSFIFIFKYIRLWSKRENRYSESAVVYSEGNFKLLMFDLYRLYFVVILLFQSLIFFQFITTGMQVKYGQQVLNLLMFLLHVTLCYNVFKQKYIFIQFFLYKDYCYSLEFNEMKGKEYFLNQAVFEEYMKREKPFLNSQLVIADLIGPLQTNRSYLSAFINNTYGMNFRMYMNKCRLMEFNLLMERAEFKGMQEEELVLLAGFKSMESFKRTRAFVGDLDLVNEE